MSFPNLMKAHTVLRYSARAVRRTAVFVIALLACVAVYSQTTAGGSIRGRVTDPSGSPVPAAIVSVRTANVGGSLKTITDQEGNYRLPDVPAAADYEITTAKEGFSKFEQRGILVRAGLNLTLDIELQLGNVNQTVEVSGESPLIETASAEQSINIGGQLLRDLPLTGRREWSDAFQLTPGIISASSDAYGGQTYFLRGTENENHVTLLDGADLGSFAQNWPSNYVSISTEALGDIEIKTGAADASAPSAMGMVINMASPTGGDQFHGSASLLISPRGWNANNTSGGTSAVSESLQPDFAIGGPIKKQKAWFFASGRYINRNDGISRTSTQISQLEAVDPGFKPFDNQARGFVYTADATVELSERHRLFGLAQYDSRTQGGNFQYYAGNYAPSQYGGGAYLVRLTSLWSAKLTTRLLASYNNKGSNSNIDSIGGTSAAPEIDVYSGVNKSAGTLVGNGQIATLNNLGSRSLSPAHKNTLAGDLTYYISSKSFGSHELQTGFYLQPNLRNKQTTVYADGGYVLEDVVLNDPNNPAAGYTPFHRQYVSATTLVTGYVGANDYAYYFQDRWRPFPRLSITAGLRPDWISGQDLLYHVSTMHAWNYAPRVGGAYMLTKNQKNVVRANWSRVTDIPNSSYLGTAGSNVAGLKDVYDLNLNGSWGATFTTPASTALSQNKTIDPSRHQGYVEEWLVGYRTQLPGAVVVDVSYINRAYKDRPAQVDTNQIYNGNVWAGLVDPMQNSIYLITNNKWNWFVYRGVDFTVTKQTSTVQLIGTYTYSSDHIAGTWQPNDPAAFIQPGAFANDAGLGTVRGNTTNSLTGSADTRDRMWQHHQARTGVTWSAPWRLRVSSSLTAQSGTPTGPMTTNIAAPDPQYGPTTLAIGGRTVSNPLATTYRFAYANRGEGQLWCPWLTAWNARLGRSFALREGSSIEVAFDAFNITNRGAAQQFLNGANQVNGKNYGGLQNIQLPRSGQASIRWKF
jgi:hypothetical protein